LQRFGAKPQIRQKNTAVSGGVFIVRCDVLIARAV
jgi:hypothetical protein